MANTLVQVHTLPGLGALTLALYPQVGGAAVNGAGDALSEHADTPGLYQASVTAALEGIYAARIFSGADVLGVYLVALEDNAGPYELCDPSIAVGATSQVAGAIAAEVGTASLSLTVQPYSSTAPQRVTGTMLQVFEGEQGFFLEVQSYDARRAPLDLAGRDLRFIAESEQEELLATHDLGANLVVVAADEGRWKFLVTAAITNAVVIENGAHHWALLDITGGKDETLARGRLWCQRRAG